MVSRNMNMESNATVMDESKLGYSIEPHTGLFVALGCISILILVSNFNALVIITLNKGLWTCAGGIMASLAIADSFIGLTTLVPLIFAAVNAKMGFIICDGIGFLNSVSMLVSIYSLMLLSINKYLQVLRPDRYQSTGPKALCTAGITIIWVSSLVLWSLPLMNIGQFGYNSEEKTCYLDVGKYPIQALLMMAITFIPSGVTIGMCYCKLWTLTKSYQKRRTESSTSKDRRAGKTGEKALRSLPLILGIFYLCWLPFVAEHVAKAIMGHDEYIPKWLEIASYLLAISNSFCNPIIFYWTNRAYRQSVRKVICKGGPKVAPIDSSKELVTLARPNDQINEVPSSVQYKMDIFLCTTQLRSRVRDYIHFPFTDINSSVIQRPSSVAIDDLGLTFHQ